MKVEREKIALAFSKKGGSTPSFDRLGENLLKLIAAATDTLTTQTKSDLKRIDLGAPFQTSMEMWEESKNEG